MIETRLTKTEKWLLAGSAFFLIVAEVVRRIPMDRRAVIFVGVGEMLTALGLGIAFGISTTRSTE